MKDIPVLRVSEDFRIQFRAELFNAFNRANFQTPETRVVSSSGRESDAGTIEETVTPGRQIQLGLKILF